MIKWANQKTTPKLWAQELIMDLVSQRMYRFYEDTSLYTDEMTEKEKEIAKITAQLEQVAEDLLDPMLDDQTTVLINHMGKLRKKLAELEK